MCQIVFKEAGHCFHVCSQENHPVIFHNDKEFIAAMNIVAAVAFSLRQIRLLTFVLMANHMHFTLSGEREFVDEFLKILVSKLLLHTSLATSKDDIKNLVFKTIEIVSLDNLRNVISYTNRNAPVVNPNENVFTYRWGANRYFFNDEAKLRYEQCGHLASCREKRKLFCSSKHDKTEGIVVLDSYVSPLCYCDICEAESLFRNSRHYFYSISRNIESSKDIAKMIGESIYYTDEDLFHYIRRVSSQEFNSPSVTSLSKEAKVNLAKRLHFDYNASNKQICRLLKIDLGVVDALFP